MEDEKEILQIWNGTEISDFKRMIQGHAAFGDRTDKTGVFYLEPIGNGDLHLWLETRSENNAAADSVSVLKDPIEGQLEETLTFSTDLKNLKAFLHDAQSLTVKRNSDSLTWTKTSKQGTEVDYTVKYTRGTTPDMTESFVMQTKKEIDELRERTKQAEDATKELADKVLELEGIAKCKECETTFEKQELQEQHTPIGECNLTEPPEPVPVPEPAPEPAKPEPVRARHRGNWIENHTIRAAALRTLTNQRIGIGR